MIGEAANHVPRAYQESRPEIPWRQVIGLCNVLAHEYGEINVDRIYNAATISVPDLLNLLDKLLPKNE